MIVFVARKEEELNGRVLSNIDQFLLSICVQQKDFYEAKFEIICFIKTCRRRKRERAAMNRVNERVQGKNYTDISFTKIKQT